MFENIVVINLEKRADRRSYIKKQFEKIKIDNYEIFKAVEAEKVNYFGKLKAAQHACKKSHQNVLLMAKKNNWKNVLIVEDDALFVDGFHEKLEKISKQITKKWDMFYLGAHNFRQLDMISENIGKCVTTLSTVAYAVDSSMYDRLIEGLNTDEVLDIYYCNKVHPKYKCYCVFPNLVTQAEGYSDIEKTNVNYDKFYNKWQ